jgi:O-antigen/teichoic acid export membrane protein
MDLAKAKLRWLKESTLARNTGWMLLGQGLSLCFQAIYFVLLARLLGSAQFGVYAGALALVSLFAQYSSAGSDTVLLRYVSVDRERFPRYWGNVLISVCGFSLVVALLLQLLGRFILPAASASLLFPTAISLCLCTQLSLSAGRAFQAFQQLRFTAAINLFINLLRAMTAAGMLAFLHHATAREWILGSMLVSAAGGMVSVVVVSVKIGPPQFHIGLLGKHLREGLQYSFSTSTASVYNDVDKTMLSHYGMNVANGIYSMAYRAVEIASIPIFSLRDAALPEFFVRGRRGIGSAYAYGRSLLGKAAWFGLLAAAAMFLLAPLIPSLLGRDFAQSASALRWLCMIPFFRSIHQMTGAALTGAGLQRYRTRNQCIAAAFNFALNLWLIPRYGWLGAAWASLLTDGGLGAMNLTTASRLSRTWVEESIVPA